MKYGTFSTIATIEAERPCTTEIAVNFAEKKKKNNTNDGGKV